MKKYIYIGLGVSFMILLLLMACNSNKQENTTLVRHYGQEKYDEMKAKCTDNIQLAVANNLIAEAKKAFIHHKEDSKTDINKAGALTKYHPDFTFKKADVDIDLITTKQVNDSGYIWVKYSTKYFDSNDNLISASSDAVSRWEIKKNNSSWKVTSIDEIN